MKTQKIEELLAENPGHDVEIWYSPTRRHDPMHNEFICTSRGDIAFVPVRDVDIKDLRAYEAVKYNGIRYAYQVAGISGMAWSECADEDGSVTVLWLTHKSYRILRDPDIRQVSTLLPEFSRECSEFIAVRLLRENDRQEEIDLDEDFMYEKNEEDEELEMPGSRVNAEIIPLTKCNPDQLWAEDYYLVGEKDLQDLPFRLDLDWFGEESFEEHYGDPNAKILVAVCI